MGVSCLFPPVVLDIKGTQRVKTRSVTFLDDPVQSMDEVHIAQFAALLRTLSKEHHRQIVIAIHERPLFDYLTLELSPAFAGDQLITVELSRSNAGASIAEPTYHNWKPDRTVVAA
jgi:DNA repair protein SbcC/Rad50